MQLKNQPELEWDDPDQLNRSKPEHRHILPVLPQFPVRIRGIQYHHTFFLKPLLYRQRILFCLVVSQ